jgi:glycosyltransferase involved in cell wall biosynthesis
MNISTEITIPILNEEDTLYKQVYKVYNFIKQHMNDLGPFGIILADNGSTDRTPEIAKLLTQELANVQYLRLDQRGVGRALKASWGQSKAEIVGYMDLDLATDLRYLRPALEKLHSGQADIVTGTRLAKGARVIGRTPLRNVTSRCFNIIIKTVFQTTFSDGMCGFKFLRGNCLNKLIDAGAQSDGWFFATEILITGEYLGYRISDLAVEWTDNPDSKVKIVKLSIEYLKAMQNLRSRLPKRKRVL